MCVWEGKALTECHYKPPQPIVFPRLQDFAMFDDERPLGQWEAEAWERAVACRDRVAETHQ